MVQCEVYVQGGKWQAGTVIGQKSSQLLIRYIIQNGEARERWFPKKRYRGVTGDLGTVQNYRPVKCPAFKVDRRLQADGDYRYECQKCGKDHYYQTETEYLPDDGSGKWAFRRDGHEGLWNRREWIVGVQSLKLDDQPVD